MEEKKKLKKPRGIARLIPGRCIACGALCQSDCPKDAIEMNDKGEPIIDIEKCTGCRRCVRICPTEAIEMFFTPEQQKILEQLAREAAEKVAPEVVEEELEEEEARIAAKLKEYKGVWVFVEQTDGQPATVSWELLGAGPTWPRP